MRYEAIAELSFDALLLPGGHAKGMKLYLELALLQRTVVDFSPAISPLARFAMGLSWLPARSRPPAGPCFMAERRRRSSEAKSFWRGT